MKFFYNNQSIIAAIIYFCFMLIDLINVYKKNVSSHNNNVCLEICMMVFMRIVSMRCFFMQMFTFKFIFCMKRVMCMFGRCVKMCQFCRYPFLT